METNRIAGLPEERGPPGWRRYVGPTWRYALALGLVAAATMLRWALADVLREAAFLAFYPAVVAAAAFGGFGPGLLATLTAALCVDLLFTGPIGGLSSDPLQWAREAIFVAGGVGVSILAGMQRSARARERRQTESLRKSETKYRIVADNTYDWEFWINQDGRFLYCSQACLRLSGYDAEAFEKDPDLFRSIIHPDDEPAYKKHRGIDPQLCATPDVEFRIIHRDGSTRWIGHNCRPVYDSEGRFLGIRGTNRDITDRKGAAEALRESEEKFRSLVENMRTAVGIVQGTRFVYANRYFAEMLGYSVEEILSLEFVQLVHPAHRAMMIDMARQRQLGEPVPGNYEFIALSKSGEERWIDFWPARIIYRGQPAIIGAGLDITERKRAEEALRESERRFRGTFENAAVGIAHVDLQGRLLRVNQKFRDILGYQCEELVGRRFAEFTYPEDRGADLARFAAMMNGEKDQDVVEKRYVRRDGQLVWVLVTRSVQRDEAGRPLYSIGVVQDIGDRKQAQEALEAARLTAEQAKAAAEHASRAKDHFMAVLSHELRTPLTPVLATVSMIREDPRVDPEIHEGLEVVIRNVELEARLIDDLLDVTRIARGKVELNKRPVELCTIIKRAVEVCQPDIEARQLEFRVDLGDAAPYFIEADVARMQQVFWNLLKNSIKFTPPGGCVGIRCRRDENNHAVVEVNDSGEGIEPEALERIFNAFEQAEISMQRQFGGLGLGLTISKALVERHGGSIEAHSQGKGKGATFRVTLPLLASIPEHLGDAGAGSRQLEPAQRAVRRLKILLVEDHGDTAQILAKILVRGGHEVETAGDVATALDCATRVAFDLLISDLGLPDGSGYDVMRELRARGQLIPAIALSGYGLQQDIQRSREAGFIEHLTKPIEFPILREVISRIAARESSPA